MSSFNWKMEP